jgi:nitroreductase
MRPSMSSNGSDGDGLRAAGPGAGDSNVGRCGPDLVRVRSPTSSPGGVNEISGIDRSLAEALMTQRAVRRFSRDEVELDVLLECVRYATRAPSGSNRQAWEWVIVLDPKIKTGIAELNRTAAHDYVARDDASKVLRAGVADLAAEFGRVPAVVVACYSGRPEANAGHHASAAFFGSIFPAVQNFLLAAQAYGLGATPTTMALQRTDELRALLRLPDDVWPCAVIPVGRPVGPPLGPSARRPVTEVVHIDWYDDGHSTRD